MDLKKADEIITEYECDRAWLVMILQDIQQEYNYLPVPVLEHVAAKLGIPLSRVYSVATFYSSLSLAERGRHIIRLCDGTACHLKGFTNIRDQVKRHLGIEEGQTTPDKKFTLETVACLGACALSPVVSIDNKCYGNMNPQKVKVTLDSYRKQTKD
jgi:NADH-quinone oxidoreductase subunit E